MCVAPQVHGDEEYWVDPDRGAETPSPPSTPSAPTTAPAATSAGSPSSAATPPAAGATGSAASAGSAPSAATAPSSGSAATPTIPSAEQPPRIETPPTGIRTGTAPRALLRPVPEGFPTPPPRPAIPNRRPARKAEPEAPARRRGPIIASLLVVTALVLVVAIGGSVLVVRALTGPYADPGTPANPPAAPTAGSDGTDDSEGPSGAAGATAIGGVEVEVLSTERGVEAVGEGSTRLAAEGEFVIVTLDVSNGTDAPVSLREAADLVTEGGEVHPPSPEAGRVHLADSEPWALLPEGESVQVHYVFDVPQGSVPVSLELDLRDNPDAGTGTVPLAP